MSDILQFHTPLTVDDLRAAGVDEGWQFGIRYRTTFGELDAQGHISNVTYLRWFETLRMSYLRDYGWPEYATRGAIPMVLRRVEVDYLKEVGLAEDIIVTGRTISIGASSCVMEYAVWADGLRATGSAVLVFLDHDRGKSPLPGDLRANMLARDRAQDRTA